MSEASNSPIPYRVSYSELVRNELEKLLARAKERGLDAQVRAAAREIDRRLHVYPQFGQPLRDLSLESAKLCIGVVPPLVVRYAIYEQERLVIVATAITPLANSGL